VTATTRDGGRTVVVRAGVVVVLGLVTGALTSVLQKYLDLPWLSLVNAASPWLAPAFAAGALQRRPGTAAFAGLAACLFELLGYYLTAAARGYFGDGGRGVLLFWTGCAVVGGPVFGLAGELWRRASSRARGLGTAVLAAAFLAEAWVQYAWRLHYRGCAVLFTVLGLGVFALLGRREGHLAAARWLLLALPLGILAELLLGLVYERSF
jgi:uncharacterized protein DUF6518